MLPTGFVYLNDRRILLSLEYATTYNFTGQIINGYHAPVCILTQQAAIALITLQNTLDKRYPNYRLKIFDAYRPTSAVDHFQKWAEDPSDQIMKALYYPKLSKSDLFKLGYLSKQSSHSRGSSVDLSLVSLDTNNHAVELDMGTRFDYFDNRSHTANTSISDTAKKNRTLLQTLMSEHGFENYPFEWWHFTLRNEPFPDTYYDFPLLTETTDATIS
jgi:D-alanyl-D-alanine dipeptidase